MQEQRQTTNLMHIIKALSHNLIVQLLSYFDRDTLININQAILNRKNGSETENFFKMVRIYYFAANFLNRTDRSLYYPFYDNVEFKKFQQIHLSNITEDSFSKFQKANCNFRRLFSTIQKIYPGQQQMFEQLQISLLDPQLPLPKLRRENVGMFCKSSFQFFLADMKYGMNRQQEFYGISQTLKPEFEANTDNFYKCLCQYANKNKENRRIIHEVRFTPEIITIQNMENFLIKDNNLHNLIIWMFCAAEVITQSVYIYLSSIQDPIYRLVQFNLRYNIYKNFVLEIEEKFSYAFTIYDNIYSELFETEANKPKFTFWRSSMAKWINQMSKLHSQLQEAYIYCLTKLRCKRMFEYLASNSRQNPTQYISVLNKVQQNQFMLSETQRLYSQSQQNNVEEYFQQNADLYQIAAVQYLQYLIDLSVNQHTVHYCGHSQHALSQPYQQFQQHVLAYNERFYAYLQKAFTQGENNWKILKQVFRNEVDFLDISLVKPVTLTKIISQANQSMKRIAKQASLQPFITGNFEQKDQILKYFNSKAEILEQITAYPQKYLYSIWPLCPPQDKLMACEVETKNTDKGIEQYFSDQEASEKMEIEQP